MVTSLNPRHTGGGSPAHEQRLQGSSLRAFVFTKHQRSRRHGQRHVDARARFTDGWPGRRRVKRWLNAEREFGFIVGLAVTGSSVEELKTGSKITDLPLSRPVGSVLHVLPRSG